MQLKPESDCSSKMTSPRSSTGARPKSGQLVPPRSRLVIPVGDKSQRGALLDKRLMAAKDRRGRGGSWAGRAHRPAPLYVRVVPFAVR
jgi:hypothetical protein